MGPDTKNNGAAGYQGPVKTELRNGAARPTNMFIMGNTGLE